MKHNVAIEIREAEDGPRLHGVILQEGRAAAGGRAEVFAPGSVIWPDSGIEIRTKHLQPSEVRAMPVRQPDGRIAVAVKATPEIVSAVRGGRSSMSVEFEALREVRTAGGVREIQRAYVDAAALTMPSRAEYSQTAAEVRSRRPAVWL
ncbi:MAG: hypothetical protein OXG44_06250 [Gammaproteobacteria bacterium]|nr:hypothetical protein [Gammaproteobacteria bacterium]